MGGFNNPVVGGGGDLVRERIRSPDYQPGVSGWSINQDGSAEFNDGDFRVSIVVGPDGMPQVVISADADHGYIRFPSGQSIEGVAAELQAVVNNLGDPNEFLSAGLFSPRLTGDDNGISVTVNSPAADGTAEEFFSVSSSAAAHILVVTRDEILMHGNLSIDGRIKRGSLTAPTLEPGWSNFGGGFQTAAYVLLPENFGELVGVVSGTPPDTIFTVPSELCPSSTQGPFDVACNNGKHAQIVVTSGGDVNVQNADAAVTWVSLAGCRWPIAGF